MTHSCALYAAFVNCEKQLSCQMCWDRLGWRAWPVIRSDSLERGEEVSVVVYLIWANCDTIGCCGLLGQGGHCGRVAQCSCLPTRVLLIPSLVVTGRLMFCMEFVCSTCVHSRNMKDLVNDLLEVGRRTVYSCLWDQGVTTSLLDKKTKNYKNIKLWIRGYGI